MLTGVIRWNPHCALQCEKGGLQSPALGLFHELSHEVLFQQKHNFPDAGSEEEYIIRFMESPTARALGEGTRTGHSSGTPVNVPTPVSH
jgi:hypothetical protein